jgi:NNP family nitrate/nitrite transporter-like MFS transporter
VFFGLILAVLGILLSMSIKSHGLFLASFLFLFTTSGIGNASTYQMVPVITRLEVPRLNPALQGLPLMKQIAIEASTTLGVCSAFGAYGGFLVPKLFGSSISSWGGAEAALWALIGFYITCIILTWWYFTRSSSILYALEHGLSPEEAVAAATGKGWWYELCGAWLSCSGSSSGSGSGDSPDKAKDSEVEFTALAVIDAGVESGTDTKIVGGI